MQNKLKNKYKTNLKNKQTNQQLAQQKEGQQTNRKFVTSGWSSNMKRKQELSWIIGFNFFSFPFSSCGGILVAQKSFFSFPSSRPQLAAATDVEQWIWFESPCPISMMPNKHTIYDI